MVQRDALKDEHAGSRLELPMVQSMAIAVS